MKYIKNFWCHKILPLAYDESLSYYEVLCKLTHKMNEIIKVINGQISDVLRNLIKEEFNNIMVDVMYIEETQTIRFAINEKEGE